jgi:hypothetical protein
MNDCQHCGKTFKSKAGLNYHLEKAKNKCSGDEKIVSNNNIELLNKIDLLENTVKILSSGMQELKTELKVKELEKRILENIIDVREGTIKGLEKSLNEKIEMGII